jgi:hypothetical protein
MSLLGTRHTAPQAATSAEAEALIAEARARARRRRRRIAVAVIGAVAVAAGGLAAAGGSPGGRPAGTAHSRTANAIAEPSAYFLDATSLHSPEIRASATGTVVAPAPIGNVPALRGYDPPYGLAATGPGSFVVGMDSVFSPPTVVLSPTGTSFYLCSQPFTLAKPGTKRITETAKIIAYRTATGKPTGVVAAWAASYVNRTGYAPMALSCSSMALDTSGRYLLVPYRQTFLHPGDEYSGGALTAARISIATGARSDWTLRFGERESPGAMNIAW